MSSSLTFATPEPRPQIRNYHMFSMYYSSLYRVLTSTEVGLGELEASIVLELKLKIPLETVLAIIDSMKDPSVLIPNDDQIAFDLFCINALPGEEARRVHPSGLS